MPLVIYRIKSVLNYEKTFSKERGEEKLYKIKMRKVSETLHAGHAKITKYFKNKESRLKG